uniref:Uncharacterized protein n=1 Tax=viral metagenome TaxID=1070528 RepID=A0A6C0J098_9ZZZZ
MDPKIFGIVSIPMLFMGGIITKLANSEGDMSKSEQFIKKNDSDELINWVFCMLK